MPSTVAIFGAPGTGGNLTDLTETSSGDSFKFIPCRSWDMPDATSLYTAHKSPNGKILCGTITVTGNNAHPSYRTCTFIEFDPVSHAFRSVNLRTTTLETIAVRPGTNVGGADVSDFAIVEVDGQTCVLANTFLTEDGWDTAEHGRFHALTLLTEVDGHWVPDYEHAWTYDELRALDVVNGTSAFALDDDGFGNTIAAPSGLDKAHPLPASGHVAYGHYFGPGGTGYYGTAVSVFDPETGVETAWFGLPHDMTLPDGVTPVGFSCRFCLPDPSSVLGDERFIVTGDCFSTGDHSAPFFEMSYDAVNGTLTPVSGTILSQHRTGCGNGAFLEDGTLLVSIGSPVGFGFGAKPTQVYRKVAGERSYVTSCPYDVATSWNSLWGQRPAPDLEIPELGGNNMLAWAGTHYDEALRQVTVIGYNGKIGWAILDDPFDLGVNLVPNPDTTANITGWLPFFLTGTSAYDAGNGGQFKFTSNGSGAYAGANYFDLPGGAADHSWFGKISVAHGGTARACVVTIDWYSTPTFGGFLASTTSESMTEPTDGSLMTIAVSGTAPAGARYARLGVIWTGAVNSEVHYLKSARLQQIPVVDHGTLQVDVNDLREGQVLDTELLGTGFGDLDDDHTVWFPIAVNNPALDGSSSPPQWLARVDMLRVLGLRVVDSVDVPLHLQFREPDRTVSARGPVSFVAAEPDS